MPIHSTFTRKKYLHHTVANKTKFNQCTNATKKRDNFYSTLYVEVQ